MAQDGGKGRRVEAQVPTVITVLVFAGREWRATRARLGVDLPLQASPLGPWLPASWPGPGGPVSGVVFHPGPGKIAAGAAAQWALLTWQPQLLVVLGTCGSIHPDRAPLDLLAARRTVVYDFTSAVPAARDRMQQAYRIDLPELPDLGGLTHPVRPAVLATGDGDPSPSQLTQLRKEEGAEAVDWESGAVAWVCRQNGVPCLILRGVSDDATASGAAQQAAYAQAAPRVMDSLWTVWEELLAAGRLAVAR